MKPPATSVPSSEVLSYFSTARKAYEAGRAAEAYRLIAPVLKSEPRFAGAHPLAGLCLINLGEFDAARLKNSGDVQTKTP